MARRTPTWAPDELATALNLYHEIGVQSARDPSVMEWSEVLKCLPIHTMRADQVRFQNPTAVSLKLADCGALDPNHPGKGMRQVGKADATAFTRYAGDGEKLRRITAAILAERERIVVDWVDATPVAFVPAGGYTGRGFDLDDVAALYTATAAAALDRLSPAPADLRQRDVH